MVRRANQRNERAGLARALHPVMLPAERQGFGMKATWLILGVATILAGCGKPGGDEQGRS